MLVQPDREILHRTPLAGVGRADGDQEQILAAINAWLELRRLRKNVEPERWQALRARLVATISE